MGLAAFPIFPCSAQMPMPFSDDEVLGNQTEGELSAANPAGHISEGFTLYLLPFAVSSGRAELPEGRDSPGPSLLLLRAYGSVGPSLLLGAVHGCHGVLPG